MDKCLYCGQKIFAYEVRRLLNNNEYEIRKSTILEWRKAGREGRLLCIDCGEPVLLKAGEKYVPHFSHKKGHLEHCEYEKYTEETKEHKEAKELLYNYFRELYPDAYVDTDHKLPDRKYANLYVSLNGAELGIEFERYNITIERYQNKHRAYKELGINDLWILSYNKQDPNQYMTDKDMHFFKQMLINETSDKVLLFLNVKDRRFTLVKNMYYRDGNGKILENRLFRRDYQLDQITIGIDGSISSDFDSEFRLTESDYIEKCKAADLEGIRDKGNTRKLPKSSYDSLLRQRQQMILQQAFNNTLNDEQQKEKEEILKWHNSTAESSSINGLKGLIKKVDEKALSRKTAVRIESKNFDSHASPGSDEYSKKILYKQRIKHILLNSTDIDSALRSYLFTKVKRSDLPIFSDALEDLYFEGAVKLKNIYEELVNTK